MYFEFAWKGAGRLQRVVGIWGVRCDGDVVEHVLGNAFALRLTITSSWERVPAELKHISKQRKRN